MSLRIRRAGTLAALALTLALLDGCGLRVVARRVGLPVPSAAAPATPTPDALAEARARSALEPREPYWPYRLGALLAAADSLPGAERALRASLDQEATYAPALALLSRLWYAAGRHAEAVRLLAVVEARPDAFSARDREALLAGLALHEEALGRADQAAAALAAAPRAGGREAEAARVYVTLRGEHPETAAPVAADALRAAPRSAVHLNNYGITRLRAGDLEGARRSFRDAIARDPGLPGPYYNLAILERFYTFDDAAAAGWWREYWTRSHDDPDSLRAAFRAGEAKPLAEGEDGR